MKKANTVKPIKNVIMYRMDHRLKNLYSAIAICLSYGHDGYFVAGNSCNAAAPHDFDIYPWGSDFDFYDIKPRVKSVGGYVICETRNALTVNINGQVIQLCNYKKPDLISLIESFDFAHIQVGVAVKIVWRPSDSESHSPGGYDSSYVRYAEYTDDWQRAHMLETTWYTGSEYPLSSLLRVNKYFKYGCYASKHEYKKDILNILNDIISRGYDDYKDYKDQLAAVDLLLLEPEEKKAAWMLWKTCCDKGLVERFDPNWEDGDDTPWEEGDDWV